jgi:DDE superfamily endonuclease
MKGKGLAPMVLSEEDQGTWVSLFGSEPAICLELWIRLRRNDDLPDNAEPKHLMWALYFLRCYDQEHKERAFLGADRKTIRKYVRPIVKGLSGLCIDLIDWERRKEGATPIPGHYAYVDCTACRTEEERKPFSSGWSSVKHGKKAGLNYELCTCIATGFIVWINGPYPAGDWSDKKIFDRELLLRIERGERVLADSGYTGRDTYVTVTGRTETDPVKKRIKARHEQVNGWMKTWKCLSDTFRHEKTFHYNCYHAVAAITQIEMETGFKSVYLLVKP